MSKIFEADPNLKNYYKSQIVHEVELRGKIVAMKIKQFYADSINLNKPLPYRFPACPPPGVTWQQVYQGQILNIKEEQNWTEQEHQHNLYAQNFQRMICGHRPNATLQSTKATAKLCREIAEYTDKLLPFRQKVQNLGDLPIPYMYQHEVKKNIIVFTAGLSLFIAVLPALFDFIILIALFILDCISFFLVVILAFAGYY